MDSVDDILDAGADREPGPLLEVREVDHVLLDAADAGNVTAAAAVFEAQRPRLLRIAHRFLRAGGLEQDVLQEAYLRWAGADHHRIHDPSAWLARVVTNLCRSHLRSARVRRETSVGHWPDAVAASTGSPGPAETVERRAGVSLALRAVLERLTPREQAVFVLRSAFGYPYREIGELLKISEAHCRQLHRRARSRLGAPRPRSAVDRGRWRGVVAGFRAAAEHGDVRSLTSMLVAGAGNRPAVDRDGAGR